MACGARRSGRLSAARAVTRRSGRTGIHVAAWTVMLNAMATVATDEVTC